MKKLYLYLVLPALALVPVRSYAAGTQTMLYDVYASGAHVLEATLVISEENQGYEIDLKAHTRGFLSALLPWNAHFKTIGFNRAGKYVPEKYESETRWKDEYETKEYTYNDEQGPVRITEHKREKGKKDRHKEKEPPPELAKGTVDALTGALRALALVTAGKDCSGESAVFDDKRRFRQVFHPKEEEILSATPYSVYNGPAVPCAVEVVPDGGEWHEKPRGWLYVQEQGRKLGALPAMWSATLNEGGPAVPVKIMIKTYYGALVLHLAEYREGDKIMIAEKRKKK